MSRERLTGEPTAPTEPLDKPEVKLDSVWVQTDTCSATLSNADLALLSLAGKPIRRAADGGG